MKLARKLTLALVFGIVAVMSAYSWLQIRREVTFSDADLKRARRVARMLRTVLESVWTYEGEVRVHELINQISQNDGIQLRLVPMNDTALSALRPPLTPEERATLESGEVVRFVLDAGADDAMRYVWVPLRVAGTTPALVEAKESLAEQHAYIQMSHWGVVVATLVVIALCGLIAIWVQVRLVGRPLEQLRDKARRAGDGDFSTPLALRQRDEIGELARELNLMCDQLHAARQRLAEETEARITALEQLRHTDRLATVGQLAAGVAHELGTPLSVISTRAQLLASSTLPHPAVVESARSIVEQADRMTGIIQQLLDFSRRRRATLRLAPLQHVVTRTFDLLRTIAERSRVTLRVEAPNEPVLVSVDQSKMQQAFTNVILNGIQAMPGGGRLTVCVEEHRARPPGAAAEEGTYVRVTIEDEGVGIPNEQLSRIFEPFYTTKDIGDGTGLGLAVADGIVEEHGGWIEVESEEGSGTRFRIFLPYSQGEQGSLEAAS